MSDTVSKTKIGAFVVGALALALGAVVVLGSGMLFSPKFRFIMYFESSVSGLGIGSSVLFRGVPIGTVTQIGVDAEATSLHFTIPVVIELEAGKIRLTSKDFRDKSGTLLEARKENPVKLLNALVEKGLRAQLVTQSFVTGQLAVSLDFLPGTPVRMVGDGKLPEIPTVPSAFEEISKTLRQLPLQELVSRLVSAVSGIERLVNSPQMEQIPGRLDATLKESRDFLRELRAKVDPLTTSLESAVRDYAELAKRLDHRADGLANSANKTMETLNSTLNDGKKALAKFEKVVSSDSPTVTDLNKALSEIAAAARSIRALSDYLERHPEALIQGKGINRR